MTLLTEKQQAALAHDLPLMTDLIGQHSIFIAAAARESGQIHFRNMAWRSERIYKELKTLMKQLKTKAENEYPDAAWLSEYSDR